LDIDAIRIAERIDEPPAARAVTRIVGRLVNLATPRAASTS
jgi:hypothetical protein